MWPVVRRGGSRPARECWHARTDQSGHGFAALRRIYATWTQANAPVQTAKSHAIDRSLESGRTTATRDALNVRAQDRQVLFDHVPHGV